ncbi:MAG: hypothetical protein WCH75_01910 [Candidatus Binatia bacterium]
MRKLGQLSLATLTLLVFFYPTTFLTSYLYALHRAPVGHSGG